MASSHAAAAAAPADIPLQITSPYSSSERRITPTWSIAQLKGKLEPVTGIPPSSQRLLLKTGNGDVVIEAADEETTSLQGWSLARGMEITITDLRPASARINLTDTSGIEKFKLPDPDYESRTDSVLAWKKSQHLGRFDPDGPARVAEAVGAHERLAREKDLQVGKRVRVDTRRGTIRYVGPVPEIPAGGSQLAAGWWVGVELDEPVGKNDGSVGGKRYFETSGASRSGVFVRPERLEVGEWPVLRDLDELEEL
ncbi:MAG: hypothetical protein M1825_001870 [Sarcosagium campestre]|nr:MAG: hypothetical protein M1825_001870 [Sarcosagium campestre]